MSKRERLENGHDAQAPKRRRSERVEHAEDNNDDENEEQEYHNEIREDDRKHGAEMIPRPNLDPCPETGYRPGSILQIYMKNVMSYDECLVNFGPTLNFVIGPNGSGKSTMLAAICLAFGAPITCMGKSGLKAQQLIKSNSDGLEVRVKVKNFPGKPDLTFKRTLDKKEKQGRFWINGDHKTMKEVRARARALDIQIVSMTRFLPQDRVKDFTTMSPKELLITTMEDVGYANMRSHYDTLVDQQDHRADDEHQLKLATDELADLERRKEMLSGKISELEEQEAKEEMVNKLEGVSVYVQGLSLEHKKEQLESRIASLREKYSKSQEEKNAISEQLEVRQAEIDKATLSIQKKDTKALAYWQEFRRLRHEQVDINAEELAHRTELDAAESRLEQHEAKTERLEANVKECKDTYEDLKRQVDDPTYEKQTEKLKKEVEELEVELQKAKNTRSAVEMRKRDLKVKADEVYAALETEKRNNSRFRPVQRVNEQLIHKVKQHAPPSEYNYSLPAVNNVRLKRKNDGDQKMVSAVVRNFAMHFVARDSRSAKEIVSVPAQITVKEISKSLEEASRNVPCNRVQLQQLGFDGYVLDLVEGPDHNLAFLCEVAKIHMVPYSRKGLTPEQIQNVPPSINKFISGNMLYTVKRSRYGKQYTSTRSEAFDTFPRNDRAQIIYEEVPDLTKQQELQEELSELSQRIKPVNEEHQKADSVYQDLKHKHLQVQTELRRRRNLVNKAESAGQHVSRAVATLKKHKDDKPAGLEEARELYEQKRTDIRKRVALVAIKRATIMKKLGVIVGMALSEVTEQSVAKELNASLRTRLLEIERERSEFKERYKRLKERLVAMEADCAAAKAEFDAFMVGKEDQKQDYIAFMEQLRQEHSDSDLFAHVEAQLDTLKRQLQFSNVDMGARKKYDEVVKQMEVTQRQVTHLEHKRDHAAEEMQKIADVFVPALENIVNLVSSKFSLLLAKKEGASGVVQLRTEKEKLNPNDPTPAEQLPFSNWGIEIMVAFRKGASLCKLDGTTQSGGERSISIGTYLLALQDAAAVPFRALDEINQALDAKNEVIMNQHVADTAKKGKQQLFLLSPKLIRFEYPPGMRILTICNGSGVTTKGPTGGSFLSLRHLDAVFGGE